MSVFSVFKRGRQAAKEHTAKQAEQKKQQEVKIPYKHVPKHAAIDAMSSGPASSRDHDRARIQEQNRKRNAMTSSGASTPAYPRVHSTLSNVSYPAVYATPVVQMPRSYSYSTTHLTDIRHSMVDISSSRTIKGKGVDRVMVDSGRASRSSSHASSTRKRHSGSPTGSCNSSIGSIEDMEGKDSTSSRPPNPRRQSDPGRFSYSRQFVVIPGGIPPVPPLPPMQFESSIGGSEEPLRSAISSRRGSPTLVPETVEEEPSEDENLEGVEGMRKGKEVRFQEGEAGVLGSAPSAMGKVKGAGQERRKAGRWSLVKGRGVEVVV